MEVRLMSVTADVTADVVSWAQELAQVMDRIGPCFARTEARQRAQAYLQGLLSPAERKNVWQLAETLGEPTPYGLQQFLYRGAWDADQVRDELRRYVVEQFGDDQAILILDETGFVKKGCHSAGVQRQYSGTAGRIENCQIGVFLAYATAQGTALIDRALYLPQSWTTERERCRRAGIPDSVAFATKPQMGLAMLGQAVASNVPFGWVTGDSIYGDYRRIRLWLESLSKPYVLAVSAKECVWLGWQQVRVGELLAQLPEDRWMQLSAGEGAKGPRLYDWQLVPVNAPPVEGWCRWLLVRRSLADPTDLAAFACYAPAETPLEKLVQIAGSRWRIESAFAEAKGEVGLDHYEVRSFQGWYRHLTLACLAHALLVSVRAHTLASVSTPAQAGLKKGDPAPNSPAVLDSPAALGSLVAFKARRGLLSP
jgi:SRSO17 transposase